MLKKLSSKNVRGKLIFSLVVLIGLMFLTAAHAVQFSPDSASQNVSADSSIVKESKRPEFNNYIYRVVWVSGLLILFLVIGLNWYKKFVGKSGSSNKSKIRIIARHNVGPKQFIMVVNIEGRKLALGATEHSINLITDLGVIDEDEEEIDNENIDNRMFSTILNRLKKGN